MHGWILELCYIYNGFVPMFLVMQYCDCYFTDTTIDDHSYTHPEFGGVHQVSPQVHVVPVGGTLVPKNIRTFNRYDGELVIALSESRSRKRENTKINVQHYS